MSRDPDELTFLGAILDSRYRRRHSEAEPEPAEGNPLRQMLRAALQPAEPEQTWRQRFPTRANRTAELLDSIGRTQP